MLQKYSFNNRKVSKLSDGRSTEKNTVKRCKMRSLYGRNTVKSCKKKLKNRYVVTLKKHIKPSLPATFHIELIFLKCICYIDRYTIASVCYIISSHE